MTGAASEAPASGRGPGRFAAWLDRAPLVAAAVAALVYLPSLRGGFLYDDFPQIVDNRGIRDLTALRTVLTFDRARPLLSLSFAVNYAVSGLAPWSYHLVNVALHAASAAVVAVLFGWMADRSGWPRAREAALAGACLFAATPMAAETVAYVASRSSGLAALLGLASLATLASGLPGPSALRRVVSWILLALAMATKEEAVAVPLLLLLLDRFFVGERRWADTARRWRLRSPGVLLVVAGLVGRRLATGAWLPVGEAARLPYAVYQWALFPVYLARHVVPVDPALYRGHGTPWPPGGAVLALCCVTAALAAAAFALRRRRPEWTFAVAWLAAALLPSSSLVPLAEPMADHRAYLGGAGVLFAMGGLLARVGRPVVAAAALLLCAGRAWQVQWTFADPVAVWEDAVRRAPGSAVAWRSLADARLERGDADGAREAFARALAADPRDARTWTNLGVLLAGLGRADEAEHALREALEVAPPPLAGSVHDNLGMVLRGRGREAEAIAEFEAAVAADPRLVQPRISLAQLLLRRGEGARARALLDEAVAQAPTAEEAAWIERLREPR